MKHLFVAVMFIIVEVNVMCFGQPAYNIRHYKNKYHEVEVNAKDIVAKRTLDDCTIYIINRNSCEVTTCDIIRVDKKTKRKYHIGVSTAIDGRCAYFKGTTIVIPEVKIINARSAVCAADYIYASRTVYYNFNGKRIGATSWKY